MKEILASDDIFDQKSNRSMDNQLKLPEENKTQLAEFKKLYEKIPLTSFSYGTEFQKVPLGVKNLATLAVNYGCSISDIKILNGVMHDQDLYALKYVKVPTKSLNNFSNGDQSNPPLLSRPWIRTRFFGRRSMNRIMLLIFVLFIIFPIFLVIYATRK